MEAMATPLSSEEKEAHVCAVALASMQAFLTAAAAVDGGASRHDLALCADALASTSELLTEAPLGTRGLVYGLRATIAWLQRGGNDGSRAAAGWEALVRGGVVLENYLDFLSCQGQDNPAVLTPFLKTLWLAQGLTVQASKEDSVLSIPEITDEASILAFAALWLRQYPELTATGSRTDAETSTRIGRTPLLSILRESMRSALVPVHQTLEALHQNHDPSLLNGHLQEQIEKLSTVSGCFLLLEQKDASTFIDYIQRVAKTDALGADSGKDIDDIELSDTVEALAGFIELLDQGVLDGSVSYHTMAVAAKPVAVGLVVEHLNQARTAFERSPPDREAAEQALASCPGTLTIVGLPEAADLLDQAWQKLGEPGSSEIELIQHLNAVAGKLSEMTGLTDTWHPAEQPQGLVVTPIGGLVQDVPHIVLPVVEEPPKAEPGTRPITVPAATSGTDGTSMPAPRPDFDIYAPTPLWQASGETVDPEIVDAFSEELREEVIRIEELLIQWQVTQPNSHAVKEIRRAFHTIKGSGRAVGAVAAGEMGWKLENLLNKFIDGIVPPMPQIEGVIKASVVALHHVLDHFLEPEAVILPAPTLIAAAADGLISRHTQAYQTLIDSDFGSTNKASEQAEEPVSEMPERIFLRDLDLSLESAEQPTPPMVPSEEQEPILHPVDIEVPPPDVDWSSEIPTLEQYDEVAPSVPELSPAEAEDLFASDSYTEESEFPAPVPEPVRTPSLGEVVAHEAATLIGSVADWAGQLESTAPSSEVISAVHTLHGALGMAGFETASETWGLTERWLERVALSKQTLTTEDRNLLIELVATVTPVLSGEMTKDSFFSLQEALRQRLLPATTPPQHQQDQEEATEAPTAEALSVFKEEALELLEKSEQAFSKLQENSVDATALHELQRILHTIKGGARVVGLIAIGDATHALETRLGQEALVGLTGQSLNNLVHDMDEIAESLHTAFAPQVESVPSQTLETAGTKPVGTEEQIRIKASLLEALTKATGEVATYRSRIVQQIFRLSSNLDDITQSSQRIQGHLRKLEMEIETGILSGRKETADNPLFDALEMDRYSDLQQYSRSLVEAVSDLMAARDNMEKDVRKTNILLTQQQRSLLNSQKSLTKSRLVSFDVLVPELRRTLRKAAEMTEREIDLHVTYDGGLLDRGILEGIRAPLEHMLRNAASHGIEDINTRLIQGKSATGTVHIDARRKGERIIIRMSDDGRGFDLDAIRKKAITLGLLEAKETPSDEALCEFVLRPGFSTSQEVTQLSGRGVGMDVVASQVHQMGGSLDIQTVTGQGTTFLISVPLTTAITRVVVVESNGSTFAVPMADITGITGAADDFSDVDFSGCHFTRQNLAEVLQLATVSLTPTPHNRVPVLLIGTTAIKVDRVSRTAAVTLKPTARQTHDVTGISGATMDDRGNVLLILDVPALLRSSSVQQIPAITAQKEEHKTSLTALIVDDSVTMRKVTRRVMERRHFTVDTAKDGVEALEKLEVSTPDIVLLDVEMPRMDGFDLAARMKEDDRWKWIPIIMVTSRTGDKHRQRALDIGVERYLGKPYSHEELDQCLHELLPDMNR